MHNINRICLDNVRLVLTLLMLLTLTQDPTRWSGARVRRDPQALHAQHQPHLPRQRAPRAHPTDAAHPHSRPHSLERGASSS